MNVEFVLVFLLAHFIGDFVFQSNKIAKMKSENIKGVFYHSIIILIIQVVLLSIFGLKGIIAGIINSIIHFAIDYLKLIISKYLVNLSFLYSIFDQSLHIGVILALDYILKPNTILSADTILYTKYLICLIFYTYITTVMSKMILRDLFENIRNAPFFLVKERIIDGLFSIIFFIIFINIYLLIALLISFIISIIYFIINKRLYKYTINIVIIKLIFYLILGFVGNLVINI